MITTLKSCFHADRTNLGRQPELDVAKGFSIICMVITHTNDYFSTWDNPYFFSFFHDWLGGPFSAAVFMFCMGISICYNKRNTPKDFLKRGVKLLALGFTLSTLILLFPYLISGYVDSDIFVKNNFITLIVSALMEVDILQFAGIFFIIFSILRKINFSLLQMNIFAIILSILGQLLTNLSSGDLFTDLILGYFIKAHNDVWFPFLNWCIIPVFGYTFGNFWIHCDRKDIFYRKVTPVCWIIAIVYLLINNGYQHLANYYALGTVDAIFALITASAVIGSSYSIYTHINGLVPVLSWMSRNLTPIYFTHWLIIPTFWTMCACITNNIEFTIPDIWIVPLGLTILATACALVALFTILFIRNRE